MYTDLIRIPQLARNRFLPPGLLRLTRNVAVQTLPNQRWDRYRKVRTIRIREALRNSGPGTYATLEAAATIYGAEVRREELDFELAVTTKHARANTEIGVNSAVRPSKVARRRRNLLPAEAFTTFNNQPVIDVSWLILEFLSLKDFRRALVNAEAMVRRICPPDLFNFAQVNAKFRAILRKLRELADIHPYARRRIHRRLRYLSPWSMSIQESELKARMIEAGLPPPVQQHPLVIGEDVFFLDFAWPDQRIAVEYDGMVKYGSDAHETVVREKIREDAIRERFPTLLRFVSDDLRASRRMKLLLSKFPRSRLRKRLALQ